MPPRKNLAPKLPENTTEGPAGELYVGPKDPFDWAKALKKAQEEHWRTLRVTIRLRDRLYAGKPASLDAAKAMLKARGLEDAIEVVDTSDPEALAAAAAEAVDEGLCEFHRRPNMTGIWFPTNNIKAGLKENWSVLGYRLAHRGSRGALAEGLFVYGVTGPDRRDDRDWIYLGEQAAGIYTAVAHTMSPKGPVSSIKRHEYVEELTICFDIAIARAVEVKIPDQSFADSLIHYAEHGLGANRSQGGGRFNILSVEEIKT